MSANQTQVGGNHYQSPIQLWDFVETHSIGYMEASIAKYVVRHKKKNGKVDLDKALHYAKKLIELADNGRASRNYGVDIALVNEFCLANGLGYPEARICFLLFGNWSMEDLVEVVGHLEDLLLSGYSPDEQQAPYEVG